jgi:Phosphoesterase family
VIPLGDRSDHPGLSAGQDSKLTEFGPTWVADVINEVGTTTCTDTLANGLKVPYWQDTAIFVTWDDWGGFWDHVDPDSSAGGPGVLYNAPGHSCTQFGCGYIYGFRVPLLVVSAYTPGGLRFRRMPESGQLPKREIPLHPRLRQHSGVYRKQLRSRDREHQSSVPVC